MVRDPCLICTLFFFFFQAEDGIRDDLVTGVQTCALPISRTPMTPAPTLPRCPVCGFENGGPLPAFCARPSCGVELLPGTPERLKPRTFQRSEERRVGKECRSRWSAYH